MNRQIFRVVETDTFLVDSVSHNLQFFVVFLCRNSKQYTQFLKTSVASKFALVSTAQRCFLKSISTAMLSTDRKQSC